MPVLVRGLFSSYVLDVTNFDDLVAAIRDKEGSDNVLLYANGAPLTGEAKIKHLPAVDVSLPLRGGKVHGSLAQAGRVRSQTPKVEPTEKKKKRTGRAKRRDQYNKRFLDVVPTSGRRRGPNSNSKY